jgi:hypothetical protein
MLEPLPNYDNRKTEPDAAADLDGYDAWLDEGDRRFDDERDSDLQRRAGQD